MKNYTSARTNLNSGGKDENLNFKMGPNTSASGSCSALLNGEMVVFGGHDDYDMQVTDFCNKPLSQNLNLRSVKSSTVVYNALVIYQTNFTMVLVERLYLQLKKGLCFAPLPAEERNVLGNFNSINT